MPVVSSSALEVNDGPPGATAVADQSCSAVKRSVSEDSEDAESTCPNSKVTKDKDGDDVHTSLTRADTEPLDLTCS